MIEEKNLRQGTGANKDFVHPLGVQCVCVCYKFFFYMCTFCVLKIRYLKAARDLPEIGPKIQFGKKLGK